MTLAELGQIGPFIGGVSLFLGAIVALCTLIFFQRKQVEDQWVDRFRNLYGEFWQDDEMARVRMWIINDIAYKEVEEEFRLRMSMEECNIDINLHMQLESMDRFCAIMVRIMSFPSSRMSENQQKLWNKLLSDGLWIRKIGEKEYMAKYVMKYWQELGVKTKQIHH